MGNDFIKDLNYGTLNSVDGKYFHNKSFYDNINDTPIKAIADNLKNQHSKGVLVSNTEFVAIVLKVISQTESEFEAFTPITAYSPGGPSQEAKIIKIIARIPEVHVGFPIPLDQQDNNAIESYPVFIGPESITTPTYGSLVRVTYKDVANQEGGIYLGPVFGGNNIPQVISSGQTQLTSQEQQSNNTNQSTVRTAQTRQWDTLLGTEISGTETRFEATLDNLNFNNISNEFYQKSLSRNFKSIFQNTIIFPDPTQITNNEHKRSYISAAVAEVLYQYWSQIFENVQIYIKHHKRSDDNPDVEPEANGNHWSCSAIDFTVTANGSLIPALQAWGSLWKLWRAGRIPNGGAGLYLNLGPDGIKGANPEQAGNGSRNGFPPGGSAETHYDFRTYLGFTGNRTASQGNRPNSWWVWGDGDSDGRDDIKNWQSIKQILQQNFTDVFNYITRTVNGSIDDPFLPPVTGRVQNIKQILKF